jgi:hypothetical protein
MALQLFEIADSLVESPVTRITFNSIPQTYTDLILVVSPRATIAEDGFLVTFNNDTATNYVNIRISGSGSAVSAATFSQGSTVGRQSDSTTTANAFGSNQFYIPNYSSSNHKSVSIEAVNETNATAVRTELIACSYPSTNAITRIDVVFPGAGAFATNTTATLYGVL